MLLSLISPSKSLQILYTVKIPYISARVSISVVIDSMALILSPELNLHVTWYIPSRTCYASREIL